METNKSEKWAHILNAVDKNDISYDSKGRLVIRTNRVSGRERSELYTLAASRYKPKEIIKNTLIHPEDRIVRKPLSIWASELALLIRDITSTRYKHKYALKIAEIYNNAAFIFLSLGDIKSARELCYTQIQLFITSSQVLHLAEHLKYVIQPWINLSRIDRLEGNLSLALEKLALLNASDQSEIQLGENRVGSASLQLAVQSDAEIHQVVKTCCLYEPIKAYLHTKQYHQIKQFIKLRETSVLRTHQAYFQEALIVACVNTGQIKDAVDVLWQALAYSHPGVMHVFKLREAEIRGAISPIANHESEINKLYKLSQRLLEAKYLNINDILFALHTVQVMVLHGHCEDAAKLAYFCLQAAISLNDELLIADSLTALFKLAEKAEVKSVIENLMVEHYFKTKYTAAKKMMRDCFPDLQHVECRDDDLSVTALYEDLQSFSIC